MRADADPIMKESDGVMAHHVPRTIDLDGVITLQLMRPVDIRTGPTEHPVAVVAAEEDVGRHVEVVGEGQVLIHRFHAQGLGVARIDSNPRRIVGNRLVIIAPFRIRTPTANVCLGVFWSEPNGLAQRVDGSGEMAQAMSQMAMTMTMAATEISTAPIPDGMFAVPAGYTRK